MLEKALGLWVKGEERLQSSRHATVPPTGRASAHTFSPQLRDTKVAAAGILRGVLRSAAGSLMHTSGSFLYPHILGRQWCHLWGTPILCIWGEDKTRTVPSRWAHLDPHTPDPVPANVKSRALKKPVCAFLSIWKTASA